MVVTLVTSSQWAAGGAVWRDSSILVKWQMASASVSASMAARESLVGKEATGCAIANGPRSLTWRRKQRCRCADEEVVVGPANTLAVNGGVVRRFPV